MKCMYPAAGRKDDPALREKAAVKIEGKAAVKVEDQVELKVECQAEVKVEGKSKKAKKKAKNANIFDCEYDEVLIYITH